jgi:hypothetical protein
VTDDTQQQGSFSEEEGVEQQRENEASKTPRSRPLGSSAVRERRTEERTGAGGCSAKSQDTRGVAPRREEDPVEQGDHTGGYE